MTSRHLRGRPVTTDADKWVDEYGDYLYRYALARVRRPELAEDLVQETFLAALRGRARFKGAAAERTWLVGILKRKIIDALYRKNREQPASDLAPWDQWAERLFDERGGWRTPPGKWPADPGAALEREEFWAVFAACLRKLPERLAHAFTLRAVEEMDSREVCKALDISPTNLWVMLHRARLGLWRCLELNWFRTNN